MPLVKNGKITTDAFVRAALPPEVRAGAPAFFSSQRLLDRVLLVPLGTPPPPPPALLRALLTTTPLRTLPRLLFNSDAWLEDIALRARARGDRNPSFAYIAAVGALSDRDYRRARDLFAEARRGMPGERELPGYEALAASLAR